MPARTSRISGLFKLRPAERLGEICRETTLTAESKKALSSFGVLNTELADSFIENVIGTFELPLGIATNFLINNQDILIPMAVEESSVIAAACNGAKLARSGGGFFASSTKPVMTGQIQLFSEPDQDYDGILIKHKATLLSKAREICPRLVQRGGGPRDLHWRYIAAIKSLVIYIDVDTREAMGANIINTICEELAHEFPKYLDCRLGLKILTNLADKRLARSRCTIPPTALTSGELAGGEVVDRIVAAYHLAKHDIYRAATHNKGVMNGIDPVVIATGNDWRAIEAGAHAFSCRNGVYEPMTRWWKSETGDLCGELELPMAIGTLGGVTSLHPTAKAALDLMGNPTSAMLGEIICSVGLAQNLSALNALVTKGIQEGHMGLHQKNLALQKALHREPND